MARTGTDPATETDDEAAAASIDSEIEPIGPANDGEDEGEDPDRP